MKSLADGVALDIGDFDGDGVPALRVMMRHAGGESTVLVKGLPPDHLAAWAPQLPRPVYLIVTDESQVHVPAGAQSFVAPTLSIFAPPQVQAQQQAQLQHAYAQPYAETQVVPEPQGPAPWLTAPPAQAKTRLPLQPVGAVPQGAPMQPQQPGQPHGIVQPNEAQIAAASHYQAKPLPRLPAAALPPQRAGMLPGLVPTSRVNAGAPKPPGRVVQTR